MKKTTSFPREAKVADNRVFRLVNESIEAKSLLLLQEADGAGKDDKVDVELRGEQLKAFEKMQNLLKTAGFAKTAGALTKGAALLQKNVVIADSDASAHFLTAVIMMSSMQQLLNNILMTVKAASGEVKESRNLNDLDALHEELFSKSLRSILLEDFADAPTVIASAKPAERSTATATTATTPDAAATAPDDLAARLGSRLDQYVPILAKYDDDGDYDKGATKELVQKLINQSFKPNPGFWKWLEKTKVGQMFGKLGQAYKDAEARGASASEGLLDRRGSALNEGFGDFIKGLIYAGSAPSVNSTVQSMLPLTGNVGIHKLLFQDLMKPAGVDPAGRIEKIRAAEAAIGLSIKRFAGSTPPTGTASAPAASGGGGTAPASGGGTSAPAASGGGTSAPAASGGGGTAATAGGEKKKSIKKELNLSDGDKAKAVLDRVKDAKISVTGIGNDLDDKQKKKLAAALGEIEDEMRDKISDTFEESRRRKSDSLIIERWQRLAGIIK